MAQSLGMAAKAATKLISNFVAVIDKKAEIILMHSNLSDDLKDLLLKRITSKCSAMRRKIIT